MRARCERGNDGDEACALGGGGEGGGVVTGREGTGPGEGPDLQEVNLLGGFVLFRVGNS